MGARPRHQFDTALVHVFMRGNNRGSVFLDEHDYEAWLQLLARTVRRFRWTCHAYCQMPNHYHLLVEAAREALSAGMRHLNGSFAQRVNARYVRTGHLFEGPYHEELVRSDAHLLELCRYIPLNPVRAGLCERPEDWRRGSYRAVGGLEAAPPFLTVSFTRSLFGEGDRALLLYRSFVADGVASRSALSRDLVARQGSSVPHVSLLRMSRDQVRGRDLRGRV